MLPRLANANRSASLVAIAAALLQLTIALSVLFLPVINLCGSDGCRQESYLQLNAGILGYALLFLVIGASLSVIIGRKLDANLFLLRCWLAVAIGLVTDYSSWIYGIYFLAGSLLMLIASIWLILAS